MKKIAVLAAALLTGISVWAQNFEQIHVFRNDSQHTSLKSSEVKSISYTKDSNGFTTMLVTDMDGNQSKVSLSNIDSVVVRKTGIPEIHVNLQDYPDINELFGNKDDVHPATLYMLGNGMYDDLQEQTVEFRGRGNSTWNMPKKPYRFKMAKKASVCGLPKAKTFALLANYIDNTHMRNVTAMWVARYLGMPFANHMIPVKVYLNDNYKGAYTMTEKIGIGGGSVDIDETIGMLFELDTNYDENYKFEYTFQSQSSYGYGQYKRLPVMVKDPDLDELAADETVTTITNASEYFSKWQADFTTFANAVTSRSANESLSDVMDLEAAVNFFIVNNFAGNHEMQHPKSLYIHKKSLDAGETYHFGPVWDFDWAFTYDGTGPENASATSPLVAVDGDDIRGSGYSFLKCLFKNEEFRKLYKQKWDAFVAEGYPALKAYLAEYADLIESTAKEDGLLWPYKSDVSWRKKESSFEFRSNLEKLTTWIENRVNYISNDSNYGLYSE